MVTFVVGGLTILFVYDNEPRNREIVGRIEKCIERGESVIIWIK